MIRVSDEAGLTPRPQHPVHQSIRSRTNGRNSYGSIW